MEEWQTSSGTERSDTGWNMVCRSGQQVLDQEPDQWLEAVAWRLGGQPRGLRSSWQSEGQFLFLSHVAHFSQLTSPINCDWKKVVIYHCLSTEKVRCKRITRFDYGFQLNKHDWTLIFLKLKSGLYLLNVGFSGKLS